MDEIELQLKIIAMEGQFENFKQQISALHMQIIRLEKLLERARIPQGAEIRQPPKCLIFECDGPHLIKSGDSRNSRFPGLRAYRTPGYHEYRDSLQLCMECDALGCVESNCINGKCLLDNSDN